MRKINADLRTALADAELQRKFAALGTYPKPMSTVDAAAFIRGEQTCGGQSSGRCCLRSLEASLGCGHRVPLP